MMNTNWLKLSKERKIEILNQATELTGLPSIAIEKDWWVSRTLNIIFRMDIAAIWYLKAAHH